MLKASRGRHKKISRIIIKPGSLLYSYRSTFKHGDGRANTFVRGILRDTAFTLALVLALAGALYLYAGVWPPLVSVDGTSMCPNLRPGGPDRAPGSGQSRRRPGMRRNIEGATTSLTATATSSCTAQWATATRTPVIHRAACWVSEGRPMWPGGPDAPHSGFLTLGDNNFFTTRARRSPRTSR